MLTNIPSVFGALLYELSEFAGSRPDDNGADASNILTARGSFVSQNDDIRPLMESLPRGASTSHVEKMKKS